MPSFGQGPEVSFSFSMSREQEARKIVEEREGERERESWSLVGRVGGGAGRRGFRPSVKDIKNPAASGDTQLSSILLLKCLQNLIHLACHLISPWKLRPSLPPVIRRQHNFRLWDSHPSLSPHLTESRSPLINTAAAAFRTHLILKFTQGPESRRFPKKQVSILSRESQGWGVSSRTWVPRLLLLSGRDKGRRAGMY